jgi:hypothetical protein
MGAPGPDIDPLILHTLRYPMLTEYFRSDDFRSIMLGFAKEIRRNYLARVPKDTGNLASTAVVTACSVRASRSRRTRSCRRSAR